MEQKSEIGSFILAIVALAVGFIIGMVAFKQEKVEYFDLNELSRQYLQYSNPSWAIIPQPTGAAKVEKVHIRLVVGVKESDAPTFYVMSNGDTVTVPDMWGAHEVHLPPSDVFCSQRDAQEALHDRLVALADSVKANAERKAKQITNVADSIDFVEEDTTCGK